MAAPVEQMVVHAVGWRTVIGIKHDLSLQEGASKI